MFFSREKTPTEAALDYVRRGISIFPFSASLVDGEIVKKPLSLHGYKDATTDEDIIRDWWERNPHALIGVPTGCLNQLFVIDVDNEEAHTNFLHFCKSLGFDPRETAWEKTPRGYHYYYAYPSEGRMPTGSNGALCPGVETKGERCSCIISPSYYFAGDRRLAYSVGKDGWVLELPDLLLERVQRLRAVEDDMTWEESYVVPEDGESCLERFVEDVAGALSGNRNNTLFRNAASAGRCVKRGLISLETARQKLLEAGRMCGLGVREASLTIANGLRYGMH